MAVESRAERRLCVVQMKRQHSATPHRGLAFRHCPPVAGLGADVVPGGEQVACVDADADPLGSGRAVDQCRELGERPAERVAAARSVLERDFDATTTGTREHLVERGDDPAEPGLEPGAHVGAGVNDHARELERLRALELVGERAHRLRPRGRVRAREVDEVARVRKGAPDACSPPGRAKHANLVGFEGLCRPLALVLQEDLDCAAADLAAPVEGVVETARNGHVSADLVAGRRHGGQGTTLLCWLQ